MTNLPRRQFGLLALGLAATPLAARAKPIAPHQDEGLIFTAESIHQEIAFSATRARLYATFLDAKQFAEVEKRGLAMQAVKNLAPPIIGAGEGDPFTLFGGHIAGRHIELVADTRIVQAWRERSWPAGHYSLVRFAFADAGRGTMLTFDHTGFPSGAGHHLSIGWYEDYWQPMRKYLDLPPTAE